MLMIEETGNKQCLIDERKEAAAAWAAKTMQLDQVNLQPVSGDASFRRYFRFRTPDRSIILMDAPPEKEDSRPFVDIAGRLSSTGLNSPDIIHFDLEQGFGLLEDFGDTLYRDLINEDSVDQLFPELFDVLNDMASRVEPRGLPRYDADFLGQELDLFSNWYLDVHRKRPLQGHEKNLWDSTCQLLVDSALSQQQVFVHRDFHSCNLLQTAGGPGIIDFQDGVLGPLNYDFVSLIWDRYIAWPRERLENWMNEVHSLMPVNCSRDEWVRRCDWMGLQRNLKIVGIFARLNYRDEKEGYIEMIPRFYQYLLDVVPHYPEFGEFHQLLESAECAP